MSALVRLPMPGKEEGKGTSAFLSLGFRPFFLSAGIFAVMSIALWAARVFGLWSPVEATLVPWQWHAHEMLFGYGMAVIAGFLLTAVHNWTGLVTLRDTPLLVLLSVWGIARVLFAFMPASPLTAAADLLFQLAMLIAVARPVVKVKQWRQAGVLLKLVLIMACNAAFYAGALGLWERGVELGIYGCLYLVLGLVLVMGRRLTPFFIERGVGYAVALRNSAWIDGVALLSYFGFFVAQVLMEDEQISASFAVGVFVVNAYRLIGWHTWGIWPKSLLWSLYLAQWFVAMGFLLFAVAQWYDLTSSPAIHAMAYGGIGMVTLAMMCRVSLGHTGRNVAQPPTAVWHLAALLGAGALVRVLGPWLAPHWYLWWIGVAQLLWVLAFAGFVAVYYRILVEPSMKG